MSTTSVPLPVPSYLAIHCPPKVIDHPSRVRSSRGSPSTAPRRAAAGVALEACAIAHHGEVTAFGAGYADMALHPRFRRLASLSSLFSNLDIVRLARRLRDWKPILPHSFEMKPNRVADFGLNLIPACHRPIRSPADPGRRPSNSARPSRSRQRNAQS
jgi:hypothetical protein